MGGTVRIDTSNDPLSNHCNYADTKKLKLLYQNFDSLKSLAEAGDTAALAIYLDLSHAIDPKTGLLTEKQRRYLEAYCFDGKSIGDIANEYGLYDTTVLDHINYALNRIKKALEGGNLYKR